MAGFEDMKIAKLIWRIMDTNFFRLFKNFLKPDAVKLALDDQEGLRFSKPRI